MHTLSRTQNEDERERSYSYHYDALNRIKEANYLTQHDMLRDFVGETEDYTVKQIAYDQNGNILHLGRFGATNNFEIDIIDDLHYNYYPNSNQFNRHLT